MVLCFPQTIHQVKNWRVVLYPGATIELYPGTTIETIETPYIASVIHACIWPASHSGGAVRIIESLTTMTYSVYYVRFIVAPLIHYLYELGGSEQMDFVMKYKDDGRFVEWDIAVI